eukprot:scaffold30718_cov36-Cyclotella_meneghiniana.AAC.1
MDPNNHDDGSKRRRLAPSSTTETSIDDSLTNDGHHSPIVRPPATQSTPNEADYDSESSCTQRLFTQPPDVLLNQQPPHDLPIHEPILYAKATSLVALHDIPPRQLSIIKDAIKTLYPQIEQPRDFQLEAINHLTFADDACLILIRRTADGKSLVPLITSVIKGGVSLVLVPLHGLGSDQVDKATVEEHGVEAYYIDEHRFANAKALMDRLKSLTAEEAGERTIILYVSPTSLNPESDWVEIFGKLATDGFITHLAIDEAHSIEQSGRSFRKEFLTAVKILRGLMDMMPRPVPRLAMSATFRQEDYDRVVTLFGLDNPLVMQGSLARRNTMVRCFVEGDPSKSLLKSAQTNLKDYPDKQQLWYCNSRTTCEGALLDRANNMIEKIIRVNGDEAVSLSFTGGDGMKSKTGEMDAYTKFSELEGSAKLHADGSVTLPRIIILTATSAANCGISSNDLTNAKHKGFPFTMYDVVQEMGRVNRTQRMSNCSFEVHCSFNCLVTTYVRIMSGKDAAERKRMVENLRVVVSFLVTPSMCYHSFIESYFEWNQETKAPCGNMCSMCLGETSEFTGPVHRNQIQSVVTTLIMQTNNVSIQSLKDAIWTARDRIFHSNSQPNRKGPVHALCLQLFAKGIILVLFWEGTPCVAESSATVISGTIGLWYGQCYHRG